jgi:hypothetical protein
MYECANYSFMHAVRQALEASIGAESAGFVGDHTSLLQHSLASRFRIMLNNFPPKILGCGLSKVANEITMASRQAFI